MIPPRDGYCDRHRLHRMPCSLCTSERLRRSKTTGGLRLAAQKAENKRLRSLSNELAGMICALWNADRERFYEVKGVTKMVNLARGTWDGKTLHGKPVPGSTSAGSSGPDYWRVVLAGDEAQ